MCYQVSMYVHFLRFWWKDILFLLFTWVYFLLSYIFNFSPYHILVVLGAFDLSRNEPTQLRLYATKYTYHAQWSSNTIKNDIALIRLPTPVKFSGKVFLLIKYLLQLSIVMKLGFIISQTNFPSCLYSRRIKKRSVLKTFKLRC